MLRSASSLWNQTLAATDGDIGKIRDFLFDDIGWEVRFLVVDTGGWLMDRNVLIAPDLVRVAGGERLEVDLSREEVEGSPEIDVAKPVSRQREAAAFGWTPYWIAGGLAAAPPVTPDFEMLRGGTGAELAEGAPVEGDPHLRSAREVIDYRIEAADDEVGHVEDLLLDTREWVVRYLVVDTRNWLPGRHVLMAPEWVTAVSWERRRVRVAPDRAAIEGAPEFSGVDSITPEVEEALHRHYGSPRRPPGARSPHGREARD